MWTTWKGYDGREDTPFTWETDHWGFVATYHELNFMPRKEELWGNGREWAKNYIAVFI